MELINQIIARMKAEGATSASRPEIMRCLSGCVAGNKLIAYAMDNRFEICKTFCAWQECSDGEIQSDCDCDLDYEEGLREDSKLDNLDIITT